MGWYLAYCHAVSFYKWAWKPVWHRSSLGYASAGWAANGRVIHWRQWWSDSLPDGGLSAVSLESRTGMPPRHSFEKLWWTFSTGVIMRSGWLGHVSPVPMCPNIRLYYTVRSRYWRTVKANRYLLGKVSRQTGIIWNPVCPRRNACHLNISCYAIPVLENWGQSVARFEPLGGGAYGRSDHQSMPEIMIPASGTAGVPERWYMLVYTALPQHAFPVLNVDNDVWTRKYLPGCVVLQETISWLEIGSLYTGGKVSFMEALETFPYDRIIFTGL